MNCYQVRVGLKNVNGVLLLVTIALGFKLPLSSKRYRKSNSSALYHHAPNTGENWDCSIMDAASDRSRSAEL